MPENPRPNTLGLGERELDALVSRLDKAAPATNDVAGREFSRWTFKHESVPVTILQPGGSSVRTRMACRNLSQGGIGLLHRSYVHVGTECYVVLPHPDSGIFEVRGRVVRCIHFTGMVHEIGVSFEHEIPVREIMRPHPMQEIFAIEHVDPATLVGSMLLVDESELDANLVRHFMRETSVAIKHASNTADAARELRPGVGIVLCGSRCWGEQGGELAVRVSALGEDAPPVIIASADRSETTYRAVSHRGVKGFLAKPYTQDSLLRTVGEFLRCYEGEPRPRAGGAVQVDPAFADAMMPELLKACERLREAVDQTDPTMALSVVMQISGVAPVMGLVELAGIAEAAGHRLAETMDLGWVASKLDDIERLCREAGEPQGA